jgi:hypothetical protein
MCVGRDQQLPRRLGVISKSTLDANGDMDGTGADIEGGLAKKPRQISTQVTDGLDEERYGVGTENAAVIYRLTAARRTRIRSGKSLTQ